MVNGVCNGRVGCIAGGDADDEYGCDNTTDGKWCDGVDGEPLFVHQNQLCGNPKVYTNKYVAGKINYQFCSDWAEQMNCSDTALTCDVNGFQTTLSQYLVCARGENCDDGVDDICQCVGYNCYLHKIKSATVSRTVSMEKMKQKTTVKTLSQKLVRES